MYAIVDRDYPDKIYQFIKEDEEIQYIKYAIYHNYEVAAIACEKFNQYANANHHRYKVMRIRLEELS